MRMTRGRLAGSMFACAVVLAMGGWSGGGTGLASTGGGPVPGAASESGTLSCSQLESLWEKAGGPPADAFLAAEVAKAESGGQQYATNVNTNGSTDRGYWQINSTWGALSTFDSLGNAEAAVRISGNGTNWTPWMTFDSGKQNGQC